MRQKLHLLLWCVAVGILAYVCFAFWTRHNAPLVKRFETQWREDVEQLETSGKLPAAWFDLGELEIIGGTPETRDWLKRIQIPLNTKKAGHYKMEVLVVVWEEEGKRGTLVQYNLIELKSKNNIWELGRTLILSRPRTARSLKSIVDELL